jgi:hypothetical protein
VAAVFNRNARGVRGTLLDLPYTQDSAATFSRTAGGVRDTMNKFRGMQTFKPFRAQLFWQRITRRETDSLPLS